MVKFKALVWLRAPNGPPLKMCILAQNLDPQSVSNPASLPLLERYQLSWLYACLSGLYISMHLICKIISLGQVTESSLKQLAGSTFGKQAVINLTCEMNLYSIPRRTLLSIS